MYLMLLGLKSCSQSLSAVHAALRGIKEKEFKKPPRSLNPTEE